MDNLTRTIDRGKQVYQWAKQHRVPIGFGTDLWGPDAQKSQVREFEMRIGLDEPANVIRSATAVNAELIQHRGLLGTISPGAYADLLVAEGDPLSDLKVMADPRHRLKVIMKDGIIYKNEL